jgi:hypothetical protein
MRRNFWAFLYSGIALILLLLGITVGVKEAQRRNRLSFRVRQRARHIRSRLGLS